MNKYVFLVLTVLCFKLSYGQSFLHKTGWTLDELKEWSKKQKDYPTWHGLILYQGSDSLTHHFISRVMDEWVWFKIKRTELQLIDVRPYNTASSGHLGYYYLDPNKNFKIIKEKQTVKPSKLFIDTASFFGYEWKSLNVGYKDHDNDESETISLPDSIIRLDTISKEEFFKFFEKYSSKIVMDTSVIFRTDSSFTLRTKNFHLTYAAYKIAAFTASTYLGLLAPLNLYMVKTVDMHNETSYSELIDTRTGKSFGVPGCSDPGTREFLISPENNFLLTYDNSYYEHDNCCIYLLKVEKKKKHRSYILSNHINLNFDRLNIKGLAWVNETSFVMSVTEQTDPKIYDETKKLKYYLKITMEEVLP